MSEAVRGPGTGTPSASGALRLLRAKLRPPVRIQGLVPRSDLPRWFDKGRWAKLILIRAPAGFGKTTVLLQWLELVEGEGRNAVWLTLDEADNDPVRFLSYVGAAFAKLDVSLGAGPGAGPNMAGAPAVSTLLPSLLEWISTTEIPFVLFLDELETIRNSEVQRILHTLIEGFPPGRQIVIATRETPDLPLARMRLREQMIEIGASQLRFSLEESERFLSQEGSPRLDRADVEHLRECTEGWPTGLQLARLALTGRQDVGGFVRSFSGSLADIADYLWEEVLVRQPVTVRDFLLKTSILERLSGPLCDAVTGSEGGYEMLARLERANLFLTPLDDERRWYRYHHLFAQYLRSRLARGLKERVASLHRAAAAWFEKKGGFETAAEHALAAGEADQAARLIARCARALVNLGQMDTVLQWSDRLPRPELEAQPELWVALCWALVFRRRNYEEARGTIARLCEVTARIENAAVSDEALALQGIVPMFEERVEEAYHVCAENLPRISDRGSFAFGVLSEVFSASLLWAGKLEQAEECLARVRQSCGKAESSIVTVYCDSTLGFLRSVQGRFREALSLGRLALSTAVEGFPPFSLPRAVAGAALADGLLEVGETGEAEALLTDHLPLLREHRPADLLVPAYRSLIRVCLRQGREGDAERLLEEADRLGHAPGWIGLSVAAKIERIRLALESGEVDRAERQLMDLSQRAPWSAYFRSRVVTPCEPDTLGVLRVKVLIAKGQASQALSDLRSLLLAAEAAGRFRLGLTLRILKAEALDASGEKRRALRVLNRALCFGWREGAIRAFAAEGQGVLRLIEAIRKASFEDVGPADSGVPASYLDRILSAAGLPTPPAPEVLTEPTGDLTNRQIEVLRLSGLGLSSQEIADQLFVGVRTVKFHMANIVKKLGVRNRREAVLKARGLGLLKS